MSFSSAAFGTSRPSIRSQKSNRSLNGPPSLRARTISSAAPRPSPLIAVRPMRMLLPTTVKSGPLALTSGGSTDDAQLARVGDVLDHDVALVAVLDLAGQQRGHEFGREMGLQVGRLIAELRIGGTVRLVEAVARKDDDLVPDIVNDALGQPAFLGPLGEFRIALVDDHPASSC